MYKRQILDVSGAFGDWGQAKGISETEYNNNALEQLKQKHGEHLRSLEFNIDFAPTLEHQFKDFYLEERTIKRDNTRVIMPQIIFETRF